MRLRFAVESLKLSTLIAEKAGPSYRGEGSTKLHE